MVKLTDIHEGRERRNKLAAAVEYEHQEDDHTVMSFWVWFDVDPADPEVGVFSPSCVATEAECFKVQRDDGTRTEQVTEWESEGDEPDIMIGELLGVYLIGSIESNEAVREGVEEACWEHHNREDDRGGYDD
jgi:hypothetical protein